MILSVLIILLAGVIAYFHYIQGFFSATISTICAVFAALLAFGYHETVVESFLGGMAADYAHGMALVVLFAVIYTGLRLLFDGFIPGNIRLPLYLDRVGAAVMGIISALFATGVFAVAAQLLPFGPSVAGYARFPIDSSREVVVNFPGQKGADKRAHGELIDETFEDSKKKSLVIPVDDMLVNFADKLSSRGSLAGARPLNSVHPDYLTELFGQRLGIQVGAKRVAYNAGGANQVSLAGLYRIREAAQIQGESEQIKDRTLKPTISVSGDNDMLLIVRTKIDPNSAGDNRDKRFRFSLGSVRLMSGGSNWYPIGTLEDSGIVFSTRLDDFLIMPPEKEMVDLVFRVEPNAVLRDPAALKSGQPQLKPGSFVEVKRMGRLDVSEQPIAGPPPRNAKVGLQWKKVVLDKKPGSINVDADDAPLEVTRAAVNDLLFTGINVGRGDAEAQVDITGGKVTVSDRKLKAFNIDGTVSVQRLAGTPEYSLKQLFTPAGKKIVQITAAPKGDAWKWADVAKYELEDSAGGKHKPIGAFAKVVVGTSNHFLGAFDADKGVTDIPQIDGRPLDIYLAFAVPPGVQVTGLKFNGKLIGSLNTEVK